MICDNVPIHSIHAYIGFVGNADKQRKKNTLKYAQMLIRKLLYQGIMNMALFIEARNVLLDEQVNRSITSALKEFRIAHPPKFVCDVEYCHKCFLFNKDLQKHKKEDNEEHAENKRIFLENAKKFEMLKPIFKGSLGRKLKAKRVLFNDVLGDVEHRVNAAQFTPYRPRLLDPHAKREDQLRRGMLVQGFDARAGVRPKHKQYKMMDQHRAPGKLKGQMSFQDMLHELMYVVDDQVDFVVAPEIAAVASIRFVWKGYASNDIKIIGEFNGWKGENLNENENGKCFKTKLLAAGRYRYRYIVDNVEVIDDTCSTIVDEIDGKSVTSNIIQVVNPKKPQSLVEQGVERARMSGNHTKRRPLVSSSDKTDRTDAGNSPLKSVRNSSIELQRIDNGADDMSVDEYLPDPSSAPPPPPGTIVKAVDKNGKPNSVSQEAQITCSHLNLRNMALYDDGAWILASFLYKDNSCIQEIDLSNNNISDEGMQGFASCLKYMKVLKCLRVNGNGFGYDGIKYLCSAIKLCPSLLELEAANNRIANDGCEAIAVLLKHNQTILSINISSNYIACDGIEVISQSLKQNKHLEKFIVARNRIGVAGITALCAALKVNSVIKYVDINENTDIGASGCVQIGYMLEQNTSLEYLNLSDIDMLKHHLSIGVHAICSGMRKNRTLRSIAFCKNKISNIEIIDIAEALSLNRGIVEFDISGNPIDPVWYEKDRYIATKVSTRMPTIQTSIDRNIAIHKDEALHAKYSFTKVVEHDAGEEGEWTLRRKWKEVNMRLAFKRSADAETNLELDRINLEKEYVEEKMMQHSLSINEFLTTENGLKHIQLVATVITDCIYALGKKTEVSLDQIEENVLNNNASASVKALPSTSVKVSTSQKQGVSSKMKGELREEPSQVTETVPVAKKLRNNNRKLNAFKTSHVGSVAVHAPPPDPVTLEAEQPKMTEIEQIHATNVINLGLYESTLNNPEKLMLESLDGILSVLFRSEGCDAYLRLSPEKLQVILQFLGIPVTTMEDAQVAVDKTLIPCTEWVGFRRCVKFFSQFSHLYCKRNKWERLRILADVYFNPPLQEAKDLIIECAATRRMEDLTQEYRALPGKQPKYMCDFCLLRFANEKLYERHLVNNRGEHMKKTTRDTVYESQVSILRRAKYLQSGTYFPAFYELNDESKLPKFYYPQVFDKMGAEGHAIGVIEPNQTLRVEDCLGEYFKIRFRDGLGWVRYEGHIKTIASAKPQFCQILVPSYHKIPNYWSQCKLWSRPKYFRYNDLLPANTELKVRLKPDSACEVIGHITRDMILEGWGILNDKWLQIRFAEDACGWTVYKNALEEVLMVYLHDAVQKKLNMNAALIKDSPFSLPPSAPELVVPKKKRNKYTGELEQSDEEDIEDGIFE